MKFKINIHRFTYLAVLGTFVLFMINACRKEAYTLSTTDDVNITGYLEKNPDQFSLFLQILERSGTKGYLAAYGKYTIFTPNNAAVTAWLKGINKTGVDQLTSAELKDVVRFMYWQIPLLPAGLPMEKYLKLPCMGNIYFLVLLLKMV